MYRPAADLRPIHTIRGRRVVLDSGPARLYPMTLRLLILIIFAEPIVGPLALGHAAHFGLGLFVPVA